jgi:hypothetical protein
MSGVPPGSRPRMSARAVVTDDGRTPLVGLQIGGNGEDGVKEHSAGLGWSCRIVPILVLPSWHGVVNRDDHLIRTKLRFVVDQP